jgi:hypothetical protein
MRRILLTLGSASILLGAGAVAAPAVAAAPAAPTTTAVPAEAPCLPVPAVGLACGALGTIGHVVPIPNVPQLPGGNR